MMFMIPMPPTSSDTPAMPASSDVIVRVASVRTLAISSSVRTMKSSGSPGMILVADAQRADMSSATLTTSFGRLGRHGDVADVLDAHQLLLDGRVRRIHRVVLVLAVAALALARQHANDFERLVL